MKYSILGFNQQKVLEMGLGINDLLILQYVQYSVASPSTEHLVDGRKISYAWVSHKKLLEDLPILDIGEDRLKRYLAKLTDVGLIERLTVANDQKRGTKSYYSITLKFEELLFSSDERPGVKNNTCLDDQVLKITPGDARPGVENNTSYNSHLFTINNKHSLKQEEKKKSNSKELLAKSGSEGQKLLPAKGLYARCISLIDDFVSQHNCGNPVREKLVEYLNYRISVKEKPLYVNMWKGMLNRLELLHKDGFGYIPIIDFSLERGYLSFYPTGDNGVSKVKSQPWERNVSCERATKEEIRKAHEQALERERNGQRGFF